MIDPELASAPSLPGSADSTPIGVSSIGVADRTRQMRQMRLIRDRPAPVVRWVGGKTRLLHEIVPRLPKSYSRYIEPFCGGAAVFFALGPDHALLSDSCAELIETYREIARDSGEVHRELRELTSDRPLARYLDTRKAWNEDRSSWTPARRAATFIYLNKSCFNGIWRVNRGGGFNVPVGKFGPGGSGDPSYPSLADLASAGEPLRRASIHCENYGAIFDRANEGDLVYVDPPYIPRSKTSSFTGYSAGGFGEAEQMELAGRVSELISRGVQVVVSQSDTASTREIYAGTGMTIHEVSAPRSVNSRITARGRVAELIMTGGF